MELLAPITDEAQPAGKKRGRKPGGGKVPGSGRQPGTKNKVVADVREMILARGKPIELLCDISRGLKIRVGPQAGPGAQFQYPSLQERAAAAKLLLDKLVPAAPATAAPQAGDNAPQPEVSDLDLARLTAFILTASLAPKHRETVHPPRDTSAAAPSPAPADPFAADRADQAAQIEAARVDEPARYSNHAGAVAAQAEEDRLAIAERRQPRQVPVFVEPGGSAEEHGLASHRPNVVRFNPNRR